MKHNKAASRMKDISSPPSRGRELKPHRRLQQLLRTQSPPSRGRELKHRQKQNANLCHPVAPFAGA